ncbi:MAG: hypothetical protein ACK4GU_02485 [Alishewanella aestuarii]
MNKNKFLLLFILCCALPLLLAKLVLELGWFNPGSSSRGDWLSQEVYLLPNAGKVPKHWRIVVVAEQCATPCQQALHTVKQLYIGLGRKQNQVQPVLLGQASLSDYPMFTQAETPAALSADLQQHIVLVDQRGLALLKYPLPAQAEQMAATAKAIRADLMKLMNYDRTSV